MRSGRGISRSDARSSVHSWATQSPNVAKHCNSALHAGYHSYAMTKRRAEGDPNYDQQENRATPRCASAAA